MQTEFLSPLNLTVDPFTIGVDGAHASPDATQLINPNRTAMLIDELKVNVGAGATAASAYEFASVLGKFGFGSTPLTNQFLPLLSFMPIYSLYTVDATLTWHFARPLYVPPNVQMHVEFKRKLPFSAWSANIDTAQLWGFSIVGRSMPADMQVPDKIFVPWACATSVYSATLPYISGDADIGNPHDQPLNIDYFAGFNMNSDTNILRAPLTFQGTLSNGKVLARDPTPFFALFPPDRPMLRTRALLQPKEFVSVVLDVPVPQAGQANAVFTTVGMTGWREIDTPLGAQP